MHARKLALAMLLLGSTVAHAQFGMAPMMNPMGMVNPLSMANPLMMIAPASVMGMGGMGTPLDMIAPLGGSMMYSQMYNPQAMMNPYLNPMAASNPYLNPRAGMGNPFLPQQTSPSFFPMMPAAPAPAYGYGGYRAPAQAAPMPFFPMMPAAPAQATPIPFFPMMPSAPAAAPAAPAPQSTAPAPLGLPFDLTMLMQMIGGMAPATSAAQTAPAAVNK